MAVLTKIITSLRHNPSLILLIFILLVSLAVRLQSFDFLLESNDTSRDYLISEHMAKFGEWPATGPLNSLLVTIKSSPIYYYILAFLISINDSFLFISSVNIFFQLIGILAVFYLAKIIFGNKTALIATTLFSFSPAVLEQSRSFWQPYIMSPFLSLSYLLLALSYFNKSRVALAGAIISFSFAAALHSPPLALAPALIIAVVMIMRSQNRKLSDHLLIISLGLGSFALAYLPVFIHLFNSGQLIFPSYLGQKLVPSLEALKENIYLNVSILTNNLFSSFEAENLRTTPISVLLIALMFTLLLFNFYRKQNRHLHGITLFISLSVVLFIAVSSLTTLYMRTDYFIPILSLVFILLAEITGKFLRKNLILISLNVIFVFWLISAPALFSQLSVLGEKRIPKGQTVIENSSQSIEKEIKEIQARDGFEKPDFFRIVSYEFNNDKVTRTYDAKFLILLERYFNHKIVRVNDANPNGYSYLNTANYIFITCRFFVNNQTCPDSFQKDVSGNNLHDIVSPDLIYTKPILVSSNTSYSVYLSKSLNGESENSYIPILK